jgi:hypothetical protein
MMAIARGFETLMLKTEAKKKFIDAKKKMETQLGVTMTHSNAMEIMCDQILSDSIKLKMRIVPMEETNG